MKHFLLVWLILLSACIATAQSDFSEISGKWDIIGNGQHGTITLDCGKIFMDGLPPEALTGITFDGKVITFHRNSYLGSNFDQDFTGELSGNTMTGTFTQSNSPGTIYQWNAYGANQGQEASAPASQPSDKEAEIHPPTATLSYSPSAPTDQDLIEFTAEASDPDGDELTYSWFVDDEEQSDTGSTMSKTLSPGDHTVTVKVSDEKGGTDEDSVHFTVTPSSGVSGDVLEAVYLQPITDATVTVEDLDGNVIRRIPVDENGKYSVLLPPGTYRVWASAPGYLPSTGMSGEHVEVTAGKISDWINFRLVMEPTNGGKPKISTKSFEFAGWGAYRFADISGKRYFAAYLEKPTQKMLDAGESIPFLWQKSNGRDLQKNGQFSEVLMDDNEERTLTSGESLKLEEGYELAIKAIDIDGRKVYLELSRDGVVVDSKVIRPFLEYQNMEDRTYYYKSNIDGTKKIVQIAVYFMYAFGSAGFLVQDDAGIGGVFQISNTPRDI